MELLDIMRIFDYNLSMNRYEDKEILNVFPRIYSSAVAPHKVAAVFFSKQKGARNEYLLLV